jgi:hypothetical protein
MSAIFEQLGDDGAHHPVASQSLKLSAALPSYPVHQRELLAVVNALRAFHPYLLDRPFELHTDNASLQWFMTQRSLSSHQARWLNLNSEYQFRVVAPLTRRTRSPKTNPFKLTVRFVSFTERSMLTC